MSIPDHATNGNGCHHADFADKSLDELLDDIANHPLRDRETAGDVTQKRRDTETQKPNPSEGDDGAQRQRTPRTPRDSAPGGAAGPQTPAPGRAPPRATTSRDSAPKRAPCASAPLCHTAMDEGRFLPAAFEAARNEPLPAAARQFLAPAMQRLVALCKVLQRAADQRGEEWFCLSCRVAGDFLGVSRMTACRWLGALQRAGVIYCPPEKVGKLTHGSLRPGDASEYVYRGD
jgi:hypothetical protein